MNQKEEFQWQKFHFSPPGNIYQDKIIFNIKTWNSGVIHSPTNTYSDTGLPTHYETFKDDLKLCRYNRWKVKFWIKELKGLFNDFEI